MDQKPEDQSTKFKTFLGVGSAFAKRNFQSNALIEAWSAAPDPVRALLSGLRTLPAAVRRKSFLYHYDDNWDDPAFGFVSEEFAGFATPRKRHVLFE